MRAIAYVKPGRLRLESRNLREITDSYPEVRGLLRDLGMREAVFDGELVAFDDSGRPSFERLQRRMVLPSSGLTASPANSHVPWTTRSVAGSFQRSIKGMTRTPPDSR